MRNIKGVVCIKDIFVFQNCTLQRAENNIMLVSGEASKRYPSETVEDIHLFGEINLNTKLLNFISQKGILLHTYNYYGFYTGTYMPKTSNVSGKLLVNQVLHYTDLNKRMYIAKQFVGSAAYNILKVLKYYNARDVDLEEDIKTIEILSNRIDYCKDIQELMGIEGNIRRHYYKTYNKILNNIDFEFEKRVRNPPDNAINSLISFVNSLMYTTCLSEIYKTQLNPTISYLHEPSTKRFSLCLDLSEIFKPILVDRLIFKLINRKIITIDDFEDASSFLILKEKAKKEIITQYNERLNTTITHKKLNRSVSYQFLIRLECYKLIKHFFEEQNYESFKSWW